MEWWKVKEPRKAAVSRRTIHPTKPYQAPNTHSVDTDWVPTRSQPPRWGYGGNKIQCLSFSSHWRWGERRVNRYHTERWTSGGKQGVQQKHVRLAPKSGTTFCELTSELKSEGWESQATDRHGAQVAIRGQMRLEGLAEAVHKGHFIYAEKPRL